MLLPAHDRNLDLKFIIEPVLDAHHIAFWQRQYRAVKGHALPKGEKLGDEFAVCWMDASTPHHRHRAGNQAKVAQPG